MDVVMPKFDPILVILAIRGSLLTQSVFTFPSFYFAISVRIKFFCFNIFMLVFFICFGLIILITESIFLYISFFLLIYTYCVLYFFFYFFFFFQLLLTEIPFRNLGEIHKPTVEFLRIWNPQQF